MAAETITPTPATRIRLPEMVFGPFVFDPNSRLLRKDGADVQLPPRVLGVLELLLARAGDVVSRQDLIDAVWKDAFVTDTSLAEAVSYLRQALGDEPHSPTYIQTMHRRGYRFVAPLATAPRSLPGSQATALAPPEIAPDPRYTTDAAIGAPGPSLSMELVPWTVAVLSLAATVSAVWYATRVAIPTPPVVRIPIDLGRAATFDDRAPALALSTSAARVAWSACPDAGRCRLYVRDLETLAERLIPQTEGAAAPFFSPDEMWLGFFADGKLKKVFLRGGAPVTIADASQPYGATWMPDGNIVFAGSIAGGLSRVSAQGGETETLTMPSAAQGEFRHVFPSAMPDGDGVLFTVVTSPLETAPGRLALMPYSAGATRSSWRVVADGVQVGGAAGSDYFAFTRNGEIHATAFDRVRRAAIGGEQVIEERIASPHMATSASGALVFAREAPAAEAPQPRWSWSTSKAGSLPTAMPPLRDPSLSPDGRSVAGLGLEARPDVWTVSLEHGTANRLTYMGASAAPVWSADGQQVFYASRRSAAFEIWARAARGGDERLVLARPARHVFPASAASGAIAFIESGGGTRADIGVMRPDGPSSATLVVQTPFDETAPALSPDGRLLAYQTDESGRWEVVVLRLADGRRGPVSSTGGVKPFWSRDGGTLFFQAGDAVMALALTAGGEAAGPPSTVVRLNRAAAVGAGPGGALLLHRPDDGPARADRAILTLQWIQHLRRTMAPPMPSTPR